MAEEYKVVEEPPGFQPPPPKRVTPKRFPCPECSRSDFRTETALNNHIKNNHSAPEAKEGEQPKKETPKKTARKKGFFASSDEGLSPAAKTLSLTVLAFVVSYITLKQLQQKLRTELTDDEIEGLTIGGTLADQMFSPILARAEKVDIVAGLINKVTEHEDLVKCGLAWKLYFERVKEVKNSAQKRVDDSKAMGTASPVGGFKTWD